ncbi:MAG: PIG-L family deacetylase [Chitinophagaceae bacterium]
MKFSLCKIALMVLCTAYIATAPAQNPKSYTSAEILLQLKKLNVLGNVLYIAAHPDDENTRLLTYLANEKKYRTGYLSLTRGDGGQNLIGDEQGIDLGLIRTQELLAARRIDGAEQFFSRAFDFGYSKSPEEALRIWGHEEILSDAVWVIRKFRPDIIIARFPTTGEGGHGHHTASAIIAEEAFDAAANPNKFPEQFKYGVQPWQAKRLLWNTFNFGGTNTQNDSQLKIDVGMYNPLLGKSYGEIAALSRSQHKSQGFGVPAQRGSSIEYFKTLKGNNAVNDLMEGVSTGWDRLLAESEITNRLITENIIQETVDSVIQGFNPEHPEYSVQPLTYLYRRIAALSASYWQAQKLAAISSLIEQCSGLFLEATATNQLNTIGDSIKINITINNRLGAAFEKIKVQLFDSSLSFTGIEKNQNKTKNITCFISGATPPTQPYWLEEQKEIGRFNVSNQSLIGLPEDNHHTALFELSINGITIPITKNVFYKFTDPVKGELYEPIQLVYPAFINTSPSLLLFNNNDKNKNKSIEYSLQSNLALNSPYRFSGLFDAKGSPVFDSSLSLTKGVKRKLALTVNSDSIPAHASLSLGGELSNPAFYEHQYFSVKKISYDHIPDIIYHYYDATKILKLDLKISGTAVGYIPGAGDKVPEALEQMGYKVTILREADIYSNNLQQFDAIVTGIRAYNTNDWMGNVYEVLMNYVKEGGVLLAQYNTSNFISNVKSKIGPYDFTISRTRITDETAAVNFLLPNHPSVNYPNKITADDFKGWIQERSIYHAEKIDSNYQRIFSMKDPGEKDMQDGSLIITNYGKGRFIYTGLVFFRELPAAVPGAYRLFANLISNKIQKRVYKSK